VCVSLFPCWCYVPGPNRNVSEWKECVDKSVRIGLTVHPDGRHVFDDAWVVSVAPSATACRWWGSQGGLEGAGRVQLMPQHQMRACWNYDSVQRVNLSWLCFCQPSILQVEQMPGPRCIFDGVLLPNGHVMLLGGQKVGHGCPACWGETCPAASLK